MGQEVECVAQFDGKAVRGKALLETSELLFRGDARLKIPFAAMLKVEAVDGKLHVRTKDGLAVFELGTRAEDWREKILHPQTVVEKLGIKAGDQLVLRGAFDEGFVRDVKKAGGEIGNGKNPQWVFLLAASAAGLNKVHGIARKLEGSSGLWIVYPKGKKEITEVGVIEAGRKAGLTDVKVVKFSDTHTALKFVVPVVKRK